MRKFEFHNGLSVNRITRGIVSLVFLAASCSCNKLVQIPQPTGTVTASQVFASDATAELAILGLYQYLDGGGQSAYFSNYETSAITGLSSDDLTDGNYFDNFLTNKLTAINNSNAQPLQQFWKPAYFDIYNANAIIDGVENSTGMSLGAKNQLLGEAKFIRAFCYFYLTNIFGDVPLVLSDDFNKTALLGNATQQAIYSQIKTDLLDAQNLMVSDFSFSDGLPIRANKWAATALLARVYLYQQIWDSAISNSSLVIKSGLFNLQPLNQVFLANSPESILEWQTPDFPPYATVEGNLFIPVNNNSSTRVWLTDSLLNSFEQGDQRKAIWIDSTFFAGVYYYYPYKYQSRTSTEDNILENYVVLRLAEQYLIRSEAEARSGDLSSSVADIDTIRLRAGLLPWSGTVDQPTVINAVQKEDRSEFFAEWGHRWFDLKRWNIATQVLGNIPYKSAINATQLLYPIPTSEIQTDPNLLQNPGYNN